MKISNASDTTSPLTEHISNFLTVASILFPFMPNAYRTIFLIIAILTVAYRPSIVTKKEITPFYILFFAAIMVSVFSKYPAKGIFNTKGILFDLIVPFFFFAFSPLIKRRKLLKLLPYSVIVFLGVALCLHLLYPKGWHIFNRDGGLVGFVGGKLTYAGVISFILPVLLLKLSEDQKGSSTIFLSSLIILVSLAINGTRSYYLGIVAFLILMIAFSKGTFKLIYMGMLLIFIATVILYPKSFNYVKKSIPKEENVSAFSRIEMWKTGLRIFKEHPLLGIGYELWSEPNYSKKLLDKYGTSKLQELRQKFPSLEKALRGHLHSNYIMMLVGGGILLFLAFIFFFISFFIFFTKIPPQIRLLGVGLLIIFAISGIFEYSFGDAEVIQNFSMALGLLVSQSKADENNNKNA